jgi:hypothetical protein
MSEIYSSFQFSNKNYEIKNIIKILLIYKNLEVHIMIKFGYLIIKIKQFFQNV